MGLREKITMTVKAVEELKKHGGTMSKVELHRSVVEIRTAWSSIQEDLEGAISDAINASVGK